MRNYSHAIWLICNDSNNISLTYAFLWRSAPVFNGRYREDDFPKLLQTAPKFDSYYRLSRCDLHFDSRSVAVYIPRTKNRLHCFNNITSRFTESSASSIFGVAIFCFIAIAFPLFFRYFFRDNEKLDISLFWLLHSIDLIEIWRK